MNVNKFVEEKKIMFVFNFMQENSLFSTSAYWQWIGIGLKTKFKQIRSYRPHKCCWRMREPSPDKWKLCDVYLCEIVKLWNAHYSKQQSLDESKQQSYHFTCYFSCIICFILIAISTTQNATQIRSPSHRNVQWTYTDKAYHVVKFNLRNRNCVVEASVWIVQIQLCSHSKVIA